MSSKIGLPYSDIEEWFGPFHYPLEQAIDTYQAMVRDEVKQRETFRAAVLAKRLLDLNPQHKDAKEILESISEIRRIYHKEIGKISLHDDFFSPLSPNTLIHFFESAKFEVFEKDEIIVTEGDKASSMMMVVSGEIHPYIGGKRIRGREKGSPKETDIVLCEGAVIGEMGLFNPAETRIATLKAFKRTITLSLDYQYLKFVDGPSDSVENLMRREIQNQIWEYYRNRTTANQINTHPQ